MPAQADRPALSLFSLCALVVANMVGTGVFTSLGYQLVSIRSGLALLGWRGSQPCWRGSWSTGQAPGGTSYL